MDVTEALSKVKQELLPRRLNFVEAKYDWKMPFSDTISFAKSTESYSVCYGGQQKASFAIKPAIYDRKKLAQIKTWSRRFNVGAGFDDKINRGFALSVLYVLRSTPIFRQFSLFHRESCHRVGCTLCKIYRFFEDTEQMNSTQFPLDLNVFDRNYKTGALGDSCAFFSNLVNVLHTEELGSSRAFGGMSEFTSAIGQMFRIPVINRIVCRKCGRVRSTPDGFWTLIANQGIEKALDTEILWDIKEGVCDACGEPAVGVREEFGDEMPIVLTIQVPWWNDKGEFRRRKFDFDKFSVITARGIRYKLCGFTAYDGKAQEGGKFAAVFLSSAGTWNVHAKGEIKTLPVSQLPSYNPQLLFYTRDEPNEVEEKSEIVRVAEESGSESESSEERQENTRDDAAVESLKATIQRQLKKHQPRAEENVVVVDARAGKKQRVEKRQQSRAVANPMEMLLKNKRVHEVATWDGVKVDPEREELTKRWQEEGFDEWDRELDKGHVRKLKKKRPAPVENPFDKAQSDKSAPRKEIFTSRRDKKRRSARK